MRDKEKIRQDIEGKRIRLEAYKARELHMLSPEGVMSYGIGSRSATRYNTDLSVIRSAIRQLEEEIAALELEEAGQHRRFAQGIVPVDI